MCRTADARGNADRRWFDIAKDGQFVFADMESIMSPRFPDFSATDDNDSEPRATELRSGTGAPIFEQGAHTRIRRNPVRAIASITWDGGPRQSYGQVINVSLSGCLLKTETTIPDDAPITMTISLIGSDDDTEYEVRAVRRRTTTASGRRAYGLEFLSETTEQKRAVQALYAATAS